MSQNFLCFKAGSYSIVYIHPVLLIHSSIDGHLGCLPILAVVNDVSVNMGVQMLLSGPAFIYFLAVWGLCCCVGFSLVEANEDYFLVVVHGLLIMVAFLVEHRL